MQEPQLHFNPPAVKESKHVQQCTWHMHRDQLNSRFHGRDIFCEIDLLPWKTLISVKSVIFREF